MHKKILREESQKNIPIFTLQLFLVKRAEYL